MATLSRNGITLAYDDGGKGEPPLVLVHCLGGNRSYMAPQFEYFRRAHRVVSVDLRGHGQSSRPGGDYTIRTFADDVAWVCGQLRLSRPILVGHSLGGGVVLETAAAHQHLQPSAVVILEALVVAPATLVDQFRPVLDGLRSPAYAQVMRQFIEQLFGPHYDAADKAKRLDQFAANHKPVMISALEGVLAHDSAAAARACTAPILYVSSGPWYTDVARFRELCPQLVTGQIVGAGHYFELEVPDQVNPMIERFIHVYAGAPSRSS